MEYIETNVAVQRFRQESDCCKLFGQSGHDAIVEKR